jgi:hypothetical protein
MNWFREKLYKPTLILLTTALLVTVHFSQNRLNKDRATLGIDAPHTLENAPPVHAPSTVARQWLPGADCQHALIRASDLRTNKYSRWSQRPTGLPNSSALRHRVFIRRGTWPQYFGQIQRSARSLALGYAGIELLRDQGIKYNPQEPLLYRELAWFFQHKMGADLDDAHGTYKQAWKDEMQQVVPTGLANYDELLNPQTSEAKERVRLLREKYKMEPQQMKKVDGQYGPLDWRMPETQAIYWAMLGLERARKEDLIVLRRVIYQSLQLAFQRPIHREQGRRTPRVSPNLDITQRQSRL